MKKAVKALSLISALAFIVCSLSGCGAQKTQAVMKALDGDAYSFDDSNGVSVHDPSIFKAEDGTYYVTGSHIASAKSTDLINWSTVSAGVFDSNKTLVKDGSTLRESFAEAFAWCDGAQTLWEKEDNEWETNVWASNIIYNEEMGKYCYYACSSVWGTTASVIWLAVSDSPEGTFEFADTMIYSGFSKRTTLFGKPKNQLHYSFTNIGELIENGTFTKDDVECQDWFDDNGNYDCTYGKYPNAIDPTAFYDANGELWLVYGSYSGGIYVMPLNEATGLPDYETMKSNDGYDMYFGKQISCTNEETENTGEGPFITYDRYTGYYYLFLTYGGLDALDGYNIREYRSENPDGPYVDIAGNDARDMKNTGVKISGNYQFSSNDKAYLSGGHSSCLIDDDGKIYQAYHTRYNDSEGIFHNVQLHQMLKTNDGWLAMLPFNYSGETANADGYNADEVTGTYELVDFTNKTMKAEREDTADWSGVDEIISPTQKVTLTDDGNVTGLNGGEGTWYTQTGTYCIGITANGVTYEGVLCRMKDDNGKDVMAISAIGSDNSSIWAVK